MSEIDWSKRKLWTEAMILEEREAINAAQYGKWGLAIEQEVRARIRLCVATYAYEIADNPIMQDGAWDKLAQSINPRLGTCNPLLDEFFAGHFTPMTGMWIHQHPELDKIAAIYKRHHT